MREKSNIGPASVEDVCVANVLAPGQAYIARSAVLTAGFPVTTAASVSNRFCSSSLLAVQNIANQILAGSIDVGLGMFWIQLVEGERSFMALISSFCVQTTR